MAIIELGALDGATGFRFDGAAAGDGSGRSVSGAGDVNGDGFDDVIGGSWTEAARDRREPGGGGCTAATGMGDPKVVLRCVGAFWWR